MIKSLLITLALIFKVGFAHSIEGECLFEEVYKNSQSQNGLILISTDQIRYEYIDKNLFTIIFKNDEIVVINNKTLTTIENLNNQQKKLFLIIAEMIKKYPFKDNQVSIEDFNIFFEQGLKNEFPRRIIVKSNQVNLSIYLYSCISKPINKLFFKTDPLFPYKQ